MTGCGRSSRYTQAVQQRGAERKSTGGIPVPRTAWNHRAESSAKLLQDLVEILTYLIDARPRIGAQPHKPPRCGMDVEGVGAFQLAQFVPAQWHGDWRAGARPQ